MRVLMNRRFGLLVFFLGFLNIGYSQLDTIYNVNSPMFKTPERIPYYEQLYRFRVTRFVDLYEKQNAGFRSSRSNIGGLIIDLVNENKIDAFSGAFGYPAEFEDPMPDTTALIINDNFAKSQTRGAWSSTESYQAGERVIVSVTDDKGIAKDEVFSALQNNQGQNPQTSGGNWQDQGPLHNVFDKAGVIGIELVEDVIFDKRRSRLTYDILAVGLVLLDPSSGERQTRFFIRYADLCTEVEKLARSKRASDRLSVMWQNRYNPAENKKFTEAFKLRLFHGVIEKVENPDNQQIMDIIYDKAKGKGSYAEGVYAMWEKEMEMMEKEHNLWEF
jgi:Gliding motility associated protein GldN